MSYCCVHDMFVVCVSTFIAYVYTVCRVLTKGREWEEPGKQAAQISIAVHDIRITNSMYMYDM